MQVSRTRAQASQSSAGPSGARPVGASLRTNSLRVQFTAVIALLGFLPNLIVTWVAGPTLPAVSVLAWMALVAVLCSMIAWLLSGILLRSLSRLRHEVERGDFGGSHPDDPAEIVALRRAFGGLMDSLETEQTRRNAFMATLVHDLKTPLIATGHLVHTLTHFDLSDAEKRDISENLLAENSRLLSLVSQMADAHRFERQDVVLDPRPVQLGQLLERVLERLGVAAQARGVRLHRAGSGQAVVDAAVLERALVNLGENALRYAHSRVEMVVTAQGIEVRDDGPGLCGDLQDLAQPFNSQPALIAGQRYTAGTAGLGLFIVRRIAEAHGGALEYARRPAGAEQGGDAHGGEGEARPEQSVFLLRLPEVELDPPEPVHIDFSNLEDRSR